MSEILGRRFNRGFVVVAAAYKFASHLEITPTYVILARNDNEWATAEIANTDDAEWFNGTYFGRDDDEKAWQSFTDRVSGE